MADNSPVSALPRRIAFAVAAPLMALVMATAVTSLVVVAVGVDPIAFWEVMLSWPSDRNLVNIVNQGAMIYMAAIAAAIGFRMNLFNIGIEGQYKVASYAAGLFAGAAFFSGPLNIIFSILLAMVVGAAWAVIPALLRVTRGVSEVISTIMLNAIATFAVGYLLNRFGERAGDGRRTTPVEESSTLDGFTPFTERDGQIWALAIIAVLLGLAYWIVVNRTRFGFDLRATGMSETAAVASGVSVKKMIVVSMCISGAVAGLIWIPALFASTSSGNYFSTAVFQAGLGFTGIAVALLGRNTAIGMAVGALLFGFLTAQASALEFSGVEISNSIVVVTQGVIVLAVVISYEVVGRFRKAAEQRAVTAALKASTQQEVAA